MRKNLTQLRLAGIIEFINQQQCWHTSGLFTLSRKLTEPWDFAESDVPVNFWFIFLRYHFNDLHLKCEHLTMSFSCYPIAPTSLGCASAKCHIQNKSLSVFCASIIHFSNFTIILCTRQVFFPFQSFPINNVLGVGANGLLPETWLLTPILEVG